MTAFSNNLNSIIEYVVQGGQCISHALAELSIELAKPSENIPIYNEGMVSAFICNNAQTRKKHWEKDSSYTMIASPYSDGGVNRYGFFAFEFEWNRHTGGCLKLKLKPGTVFYYTGCFIMHRQVSQIDLGRNFCDFNCWNLSSYTNKRLYDNVKKSLNGTRKPKKRKIHHS